MAGVGPGRVALRTGHTLRRPHSAAPCLRRPVLDIDPPYSGPPSPSGALVPATAAAEPERVLRRGAGIAAEPHYIRDCDVVADPYGWRNPVHFRPPRLLHRQWAGARTIAGRSELPLSDWDREPVRVLVPDAAGGMQVQERCRSPVPASATPPPPRRSAPPRSAPPRPAPSPSSDAALPLTRPASAAPRSVEAERPGQDAATAPVMVITSVQLADGKRSCSHGVADLIRSSQSVDECSEGMVAWSYDQFDTDGVPILGSNRTPGYLARGIPKRAMLPPRQASGPVVCRSPEVTGPAASPPPPPCGKWTVTMGPEEGLLVQAYDAQLQPIAGDDVRPHMQRPGRKRRLRRIHHRTRGGLRRFDGHKGNASSVSFAHYHYPSTAGESLFNLPPESPPGARSPPRRPVKLPPASIVTLAARPPPQR
eukprot:TRINITY_DN21789_c0_g1_i1.p1 TRINITY_DN21789_c0_g1~~TRINITY_DN21789_c0_g1_i1.p1  ORF type:complete len:462 (+),score=140.91 TRINITY_DN21789_c0_g1_i1:119-1387(+)